VVQISYTHNFVKFAFIIMTVDPVNKAQACVIFWPQIFWNTYDADKCNRYNLTLF